ncbi:sensor histidine kinase [Pontivivens insulae]|uniref:histidine kinase n=1 Tax=Pontivivens insulae TaxID=1639689 RepID=A0A2R8ACT6_9RHOB|nr:sensor histidine kinase [Pontivivens insulae]RED13975.1 two-component system sensor histidine kinase TctE [Pontivivens insulae]SPF30049.1 Sensor protein QseC [Pontivivens insulae]
MNTATVPASGSIRRRLIVQLVAGAAVLAALLFFVVQDLSRRLAENAQDNVLIASATSISDAMRVEGQAITVDIPYSALSMLGSVSDDRVFYAVLIDGELLTGYENLEGPEGGGAATGRYAGDDVRVVAVERTLSVAGTLREARVIVAQTRSGQQAVRATIAQVAATLGVGFFVLSVVSGILAANAAVRPLRRLTGSIARRGPDDLRPVTAPAPQEMLPLVSALNGFMERLKASLSRSEDFIAEAAHRVRTPLATVRTQAEIALRRVERPENRAALREMIRAIDESSRSAGQLLDHAVVTFRSDTLEQTAIDLQTLAEETAERLAPLAEMRDIDLIVAEDSMPAPTRGDPILLTSALRNVLDNAIKYGPEAGRVTMRSYVEDQYAILSVEDEGKGFPDGEQALTGRFARGANVGGIVGSGLGLTIVEEVVSTHGGQLILRNHPEGGGACVLLCLPYLP